MHQIFILITTRGGYDIGFVDKQEVAYAAHNKGLQFGHTRKHISNVIVLGYLLISQTLSAFFILISSF